MRNLRTACFALLGLSLIACRSDDPKTGDDAPDAPPNVMMHIQDVQNDSLTIGSAVALSGVIVTAIDIYGARTGDIWLQEPGGGEFSGVHVFGVPTEQVAMLQLGDVVDLVGASKDEFVFNPQPGETGSVTELEPNPAGSGIVVTKTSSGAVPAPMVVDALAIGMMADEAARDAEWEKWEGVLITVNNVSATSALSMTVDKPDQTKIAITGGIQLEAGLTDIGMPVKDDCFASVTGVLDWFYDYDLYPRSMTDLATGGAACPVKETDHATCSDGVDNDGNGFSDCMDFSCQQADPMCSSSATIAAIQAGTITGPVSLADVYVAGVSFNKKNIWVTQNLTAAANEGIYVRSMANFDVAVVIGAKVTITGTAEEFNNDAMGESITQIKSATAVVTAAPTTAPTPVLGQTATTLDVAATGEPYESVLVTLANVQIVSTGDNPTFFVGSATQGGHTFKTDDDVYRLVAADVGQCWAIVTGIWSYSVFENSYIFLPLAQGTGTGVCN